ncbi:MAG: hypothetical protein Q4F17_11090 [Eubacteriales bacterium]|nr:hypothetical protein [Eubacteriales bacterium]
MKRRTLLLLALMLPALCGCQAQPQSIYITEPAPTYGEPLVFETALEGQTQPEDRQAALEASFQSADGTVEFSFHIDQELPAGDLRILEAVPRPITGEDAQKLAQVVFPDCTFYDQEPQSSKLYSKEEVERNIALYTKYSDLSALTELYGSSAREQSIYVAHYREFWEKQLKKAKKENPHRLCDWEFKPDMYYYDIDQRDENNYWTEIYALTRKGDVEYLLSANKSTNPKNRHQKLGISVDGELLTHQLGWYSLVNGDFPTPDQVDQARERAQNILDELDVGRWRVRNAQLRPSDLVDGMCIEVEADMLLDGMLIPNRPGMEDGFAYSGVSMVLNSKAELAYLDLWNPMELKGTVTDRPNLLSLDELFAQAGERLTNATASDRFGHDMFPLHIEEERAGERLTCKVDVTKVEYTMARMKAPDDADTFYFYPELTFSGTAGYYGSETGTCHITCEEAPLFSISALDGELRVF